MTQVYRMLELYSVEDPQVPLDLSILITHWLRRHIRERDQVFADYLRKSKPSQSAN